MKHTILFVSLILFYGLAGKSQVEDYGKLVAYICNPSMVGENQLPPHVSVIPFETPEQALAGDREESGYYQTLNGTWKFLWTGSPLESPSGFQMPGYDASEWNDIQVPGTWQMQGFGHNIYRNVPMEFAPYDPPNVPLDFNPSGYYIRDFELPDNWSGRQTVLHFDGVKSAYWVWINGHYLGFDKGSMTPAEFDLSPYLNPGSNKIAVQVVRWSDGSYLEDQDMWRFAGIYRRVYLYSRPWTGIGDVFVRTDLDDACTDATLSLDCHLYNASDSDPGKLKLSAVLYNSPDREVSDFSKVLKSLPPDREADLTLSQRIEKPLLWSDESPNLYRLILCLENQAGDTLQILEQKVGFRELEIRNAQLLLNGKPLMIRGVNRHEHDPLTGRTMSRERIEQDFRLMKELNVNSIRTSHYPNDPEFYDLADKWGLYVCNEVNAECHYGEHYLAGQPGWERAFLDRTAKYVQRDKNHPCVILWSMGNECGLAPVHYRMAEYVRKSDPTRFVYHQTNYPNGDAPFADVCGTRYPNPAMLDAIGDTTQRPVILGEYAHAVANSMGHFDEYWERFNRYPSLQGGFIWDWVNQGIREHLVTTPDRSAYGQQAVLMGRPGHVEGKTGMAVSFSGLDDFVEVTPAPVLNLTGNRLTLQAWIYPRGFKGLNALITKGDQAFALEQQHKDSLRFTLYTDRKYEVRAFLPRDWNYNWHHVAGIYDGSSLAIWLDGSELSSVPAKGNIRRTRHPVTVGKNHESNHENSPGPVSNALFDEVMIHAAALDPGDLGWNRPTPGITPDLVLWLPFEELNDEGTFLCYGATPFTSATMDGIIFSERKYQPESWQVKQSQSPVRMEAVNLYKGLIKVSNLNRFTNLDEFTLRWKLLEDGRLLKEGELSPALDPMDSKIFTIPVRSSEMPAGASTGIPGGDSYAVLNGASSTTSSGASASPSSDAPTGAPSILAAGDEFPVIPGAEYFLRIGVCTRGDRIWAPEGFEVGFEEFRLPCSIRGTEATGGSDPLEIREREREILIIGNGFSYRFDRETGRLEQISFKGTDFLAAGPRLNVSRPPIVNEISAWTRAEYLQWWYKGGLDSLVHELVTFYNEKISDSEYLIRTRINSYAFKDRTLQFVNEFEYRFLGSGDLIVDHDVTCNLEFPARRASEDIPWIQKIGLRMELAPGTDKITWYGRGPFETYPDRKTGAKTGIWSEEIREIRMPYILPQEFGNHTDVRWTALQHDKGAGLAFFAKGMMNVSINPYSNLEDTWYPYQLKRKQNVTLNIDHRVSGVGGTPITVRHAYRTYPDHYHYRVRIRPYDPELTDPVTLGRQNW